MRNYLVIEINNMAGEFKNIISITDKEGNRFDYDPQTESISLNDVIMSSLDYEPVFINSTTDDETPPIFSGIFMKKLGKILGLNGKVNRVVRNG